METTENPTVKSKRDLLMERMRTRYPDREFADDEEMFGQIGVDYDDYEQKLNDYKGREKAISDMYTSDPRSAAMMTAWRNGEDPLMYGVRRFGQEFIDALNDPAKQEQLAASQKEYLERVAEEKRLEEEYNKNLDATYAMLDKMQQERGLDDKTLGDAIALLRKIFEDALVGKFTEEEIDMALKAMNHDADVAQAERTGEVRGKNTRAEAQLRQRTGDGTTVLDGRNNATREQPRRDLGVLNNYGDDTRDIWERGRKK